MKALYGVQCTVRGSACIYGGAEWATVAGRHQEPSDVVLCRVRMLCGMTGGNGVLSQLIKPLGYLIYGTPGCSWRYQYQVLSPPCIGMALPAVPLGSFLFRSW